VRGIEFKVSGPEDAIKADEVSINLSKELAKELGLGFEGFHRNVCRQDWDYKVHFTVTTPEDFDILMQTPAVDEAMNFFKSLSTDSTIHTQSFVHEDKRRAVAH